MFLALFSAPNMFLTLFIDSIAEPTCVVVRGHSVQNVLSICITCM